MTNQHYITSYFKAKQTSFVQLLLFRLLHTRDLCTEILSLALFIWINQRKIHISSKELDT